MKRLIGLLTAFFVLSTGQAFAQEKVYKVRDIGPAGGRIFYVNPNYAKDGWRYLEAAPKDQNTKQTWANIEDKILIGTGTAIGTGKTNTIAIIAKSGSTHNAARSCDELLIGGYSGWFLPSLDELSLMYTNLHSKGIGCFANGRYWSSSESNMYGAWARFFSFDDATNENETIPYYVRCVREI